ncbi:flap endonuclease-1 [Methanococcoides methylutens]|uniref:Flap endonuclease 1 n=1 Tax=Methanococcoides methylutens MM1 TaxID=1434104 RepID=A0A0E3X0B1_METMT|nr:flap endonuclease-1 [Methanococcoides methylutens]AKB84195.1 Flap structure-specific endonuclease [Methanococcoides methylutens MM1]
MGTDIGDLLQKHTVEIAELSNKVVAIDAYNTLYQFLSIIRQRDGTPLKDSSGQVTSHLSGILYRFTNLIESGVKPVFVFDGKPPEFKSGTLEKRHEVRENASAKWEDAKVQGLEEEAYKYAQASSKVTKEIIEDSIRLIELMGIPYVRAPSEGEAQAAYMVRKGDADFIGSQDYDSLLFGAPSVIRNLTITGKRKLPRKNIYVDVKPEMISLEESLEELGVTRSQLIDIAMCIGTDYNPGLENIGPKRALKLVKEHGNIETVLSETDKEIEELDAKKEFFLNPPVTDDYDLKWIKPDRAGVVAFLCKGHDFSEDRVNKALDRLEANMGGGQSTLDQWF